MHILLENHLKNMNMCLTTIFVCGYFNVAGPCFIALHLHVYVVVHLNVYQKFKTVECFNFFIFKSPDTMTRGHGGHENTSIRHVKFRPRKQDTEDTFIYIYIYIIYIYILKITHTKMKFRHKDSYFVRN
jgi:hypothetical protein